MVWEVLLLNAKPYLDCADTISPAFGSAGYVVICTSFANLPISALGMFWTQTRFKMKSVQKKKESSLYWN